jgi:hypothetical protein
MTSTGLVIIPLAFLIILLPRRYSIIALLVFATLDSAAVVNVGSFGLQPGYFLGMLMIARTAVEIVVLAAPLNAHVVRMLMPLLLFTIICFISIWVGLTFFQGRIMVISGLAGFNLDLAQPYTFQRQNLTQPFYLLLNVSIVYALAHRIACLPANQVAATLDQAVLGAILFASLVAIWEMAQFYWGLPFPSGFFHSNAIYAAAYGQVLAGGILRVSGSFSEPSALAYPFAAFLMYAWDRYLRRPGTGAMAVVLLCLAVMAASTSTTAFVVLGIFALIVLKDLLVLLATARGIKLSTRHLGAFALVGGAALGTLVFIQSHAHDVQSVLTGILLEKPQSGSFADRSGADMMAIDIALQTGGIGIGLGSHKPNNLAMTLLSNTGIAGVLLFAIFLFGLLRPRRAMRSGLDLKPYRWMVVGLLSVHLISNPNLNPIILWISFALVIGALAAERATSSGAVDRRSASLAPAWQTITVHSVPPRSSIS